MVPPLGPFFVLAIERRGCSTTLSVPASLSPPTRRQRLLDWLKKEQWAVRGGTANVTAAAPTEAAAHAAELLFVRDVLGPLRLRPGAVPEKAVARLLSVGVLALHNRCMSLFGQRWADFLLARWPESSPSPAPSATAPSATAPAGTLPMVGPAPAPPAASFKTPAPRELALAPLPPLLGAMPLLPSASEAAEEMGLEDSHNLVAFLLGCTAGSACCGNAAACCGDNGEELESFFFTRGAADDLAAAVAAEAEWEASVPPTPTPAPMSATTTTAAAAAAAAQTQAPLLVPLPTSQQPAAAEQPFAAEQPCAAACWVPLDLPADVPEAPAGFCPDLLSSVELDWSAELAAGADLDGADLELLRDDDMWDLFPPPSPAPGL